MTVVQISFTTAAVHIWSIAAPSYTADLDAHSDSETYILTVLSSTNHHSNTQQQISSQRTHNHSEIPVEMKRTQALHHKPNTVCRVRKCKTKKTKWPL